MLQMFTYSVACYRCSYAACLMLQMFICGLFYVTNVHMRPLWCYRCSYAASLMLQMFICGLAFATFSVDCRLPQNRLQLSFLLLLTTITFKFVVSQTLPRISYLTYLVSGAAFCYLTNSGCLPHESKSTLQSGFMTLLCLPRESKSTQQSVFMTLLCLPHESKSIQEYIFFFLLCLLHESKSTELPMAVSRLPFPGVVFPG